MAVQQAPAARGLMPQYRNTQQSPPATFGQRQNYGSPVAMPTIGMHMPVPSMAPVTVGATYAGTRTPALTTPYPYQAAPPVTRERGASGTGRRGGLSGIASTFIFMILCLVIGGGIYYFIDQNGPSAPPTDTVTDTVNEVDITNKADITTKANIAPPRIQNVLNSEITERGATITWKTTKPAASRLIVHDSDGVKITEIELQEALANNHSVTIRELEPGKTYKYTVISRDAAGNEITYKGNLTTSAQADTTPPAISGVNVSNITESSAIITWRTDEPATSQVIYGKTEVYDLKTTEIPNLTTSHSVTLTGLDDSTTYNFQVLSKDSGGNAATPPANQTFETQAVIPVGYEKGNRAPDFTLEDLNGRRVSLSDFRGKPVLVNFWAVWCVPCKDELPYIQAISDNWSKEDLMILAIDLKETKNQVRSFVANREYTFPVLLDLNGEVGNLYNITGIPMTFLIDEKGIIKEIQKGSFLSQTELDNMLDSLE